MSGVMAPPLVVASAEGLWSGGELVALEGRDVTFVAGDGDGWLAVVDRRDIVAVSAEFAETDAGSVTSDYVACVGRFDGTIMAGTGGAHLVGVSPGGSRLVEGFEHVEGRAAWNTPWGDPPAVRSIAQGPDGLRWVNVHVGGVVVGDGESWRPTVDIGVDVHQVVVDPNRDGVALVATGAAGLGITMDGGRTWEWNTPATRLSYMSGVGLSEGRVMVSCARGPHGGKAAVYRGTPSGRLTRATRRYPKVISTYMMAVAGDHAAYLTPDGRVMASADFGDSWVEAFEVAEPRALAYSSG